MSNIVDLSKLSFKELKKELYNCKNDPIKELTIRQMMRERYIAHLKKKKFREQHYLKKTRINNQESDRLIEELIEEMDDIDNNDDNQDYLYNRRMTNKKKSINDIHKKETNNDFLNNNLMKRMNGEMDIRKNKKNISRAFIPPYTDDTGATFAPYHKQRQTIQTFF